MILREVDRNFTSAASIFKGRVQNVKRFVPIDLTSKLSSMEILIMMFEPLLEKIEESVFSEMGGKGGTLKLENR